MTTTNRHVSGIVSINIATIFFGLAGVLGKISEAPALTITLVRVIVAGGALVTWALATHTPLRPKSRRDLWLLATQGIILAVHWTAFFQAIIVSSVAIGLLAFSSFPLFTAMLEPLLLGQRPRRSEIVASVLILIGVYLLVPRFSLANHATQGVMWGLIAGFTFALLSVVNRGLTRRYPSITISLYQDSIAALVLAPTLALVPYAGPLTVRGILSLLALGLLCTALAHTLFINGLRTVTAQLASVIATLEPVWGVLFAALLLGELPTPRTLAGGALIIGATLIPALATLTRHETVNSLQTGNH